MKLTMPRPLRCVIYTRKSTEHNLDLAFNSLDAQREAWEAYIKSQAHEGWRLLPEHYDDGGLSGASLERPALQLLLTQVKDRVIGFATAADERQGGRGEMGAVALEQEPNRLRRSALGRNDEIGVGHQGSIEPRKHASLRSG